MKTASLGFFSAASLWVLAGAAGAAPEVAFEPVFAEVKHERPVQVVAPPDGSGRQFLVEQRGVITLLPADEGGSPTGKTFLDISERPLIENAFEEGLLNLTFHPGYKENGRAFVYYTIQNPKRSRVSEFLVSADDPDRLDPASERVLIEIPQPFWNHNSGNMLFGPDGFLIVAVGDGGKANDFTRLAQNTFVFNGKLLRIDVDGRDGDLPYAIPPDNPFVKAEGFRPEIYALGLRNPWGLAFDSEGRFWCADVGQALWEEINLIEPGGNYGWSYREGTHPFELGEGPLPEDAEIIDPIHEYPHSDGISITGGFVYEGDRIPDLKGAYVYGDYAFGTIWALRHDGTKVTENHVIRQPTPSQPFRPTAFCPDPDGEILVLSWDGKIYRIVPASQ